MSLNLGTLTQDAEILKARLLERILKDQHLDPNDGAICFDIILNAFRILNTFTFLLLLCNMLF